MSLHRQLASQSLLVRYLGPSDPSVTAEATWPGSVILSLLWSFLAPTPPCLAFCCSGPWLGDGGRSSLSALAPSQVWLSPTPSHLPPAVWTAQPGLSLLAEPSTSYVSLWSLGEVSHEQCSWTTSFQGACYKYAGWASTLIVRIGIFEEGTWRSAL